MKQVVNKLPDTNLVLAENMKSQSCIGFIIGSNQKGWLQMVGYASGEYIFLAKNGGTSIANGWPNFGQRSLVNALAKLYENNATVFLFEDETELFGWLSSKK